MTARKSSNMPKPNNKARLNAKSHAQEYQGAKSSQYRNRTIALSTMPLILALLFLTFLVVSAFFHSLPMGLAGMYLTLSLLCFIAYAIDKSAAKHGRWRTKESTLHVLALAGGWPGALCAQHLLRHKTVKTTFKRVFWLTVLTNLGVLGYGIKTGAVHMFI